jgi:hypothetical protein
MDDLGSLISHKLDNRRLLQGVHLDLWTKAKFSI